MAKEGKQATEINNMKAYITKLEAALSGILPFIPDGNNTESPGIVAWHFDHRETITRAANATGRGTYLV